MQEKKHSGMIFSLLFAFIPSIFWIFTDPFSEKFSSFQITTTSIGQLAGLTGMSFFALSFILAARFDFVTNLFGGNGKVSKIHHYFGGTAFSLLLLHPVLLSIKYALNSPSSAYFFFKPINDLATFFGESALGLMMLFLFFTFYIRLKGKFFKWVHRISGIAFLFGTLHLLFVQSTVLYFLPLKIYMLTFSLIGNLCFFSVLFKKRKYQTAIIEGVS